MKKIAEGVRSCSLCHYDTMRTKIDIKKIDDSPLKCSFLLKKQSFHQTIKLPLQSSLDSKVHKAKLSWHNYVADLNRIND